MSMVFSFVQLNVDFLQLVRATPVGQFKRESSNKWDVFEQLPVKNVDFWPAGELEYYNEIPSSRLDILPDFADAARAGAALFQLT